MHFTIDFDLVEVRNTVSNTIDKILAQSFGDIDRLNIEKAAPFSTSSFTFFGQKALPGFRLISGRGSTGSKQSQAYVRLLKWYLVRAKL